jgi:predicted glutamine amidotransferase
MMFAVMCRLLGIAGAPPLPIKEALTAFQPLCRKGLVSCGMPPGHQDGWGISGYSRERAVYFGRRAESAEEDHEAFQQAIDKAQKSQTPVLIAHLRKSSVGPKQINNTHPFHWRDWVFAHNGTLFNALGLDLQEATPQGTTDSERLGLWLIERIIASMNPTETLAQLLREQRSKWSFSSLAFLLSDGKTLWAYKEAGDKNLNAGDSVEDRKKNYALHFLKRDHDTIICSEPLTPLGSGWKEIEQRQLLVCSAGNLVHQMDV